jgi:prophage antirepressor-like protein
MNEIVKTFNGQDIRILEIDCEPWFVAKDICKYFGESNYRRAIKNVDADDKGVSQINTPGGKQKMTTVNESGLYSLLFAMQPERARGVTPEYIRDRQEKVRFFKRWVTHDVLPSIRKTGAYLSPAISDRQVEALITTLEQEVCRRIAAEQEMKCLQRQLEKLALAALPKSAFGEPSRTTGLPKDKVISTHLRSSRRPHRPQVEKYIQLLLPLYAARELLAEALLPALGAGALETKEERNA